MANSLTSSTARARHGVPLLVFIALCLLATTATAQRIDKYYSAATQENGTLYYILPASFSDAHTPPHIPLTYDITYLSGADSARLSFTYIKDGDFAIESIALIFNNNSRIDVPATKLFIEPYKRKFKYRYSAMLPYSAIKHFFAQEPPAVISLVTATTHADLEMRPKAWHKRTAITNRILQLIALNRK